MSNRRGLALIIVLAIVAILSVLVIEFSYSVWVDLYLSANYLSRTQAVEAAKAGVEYGIYVLRRDADTAIDSLGEEWAQPMEITIGELVPPPDPEAEEGEERTDWYAELGKRARGRFVEPRAGGRRGTQDRPQRARQRVPADLRRDTRTAHRGAQRAQRERERQRARRADDRLGR
jgi:hypothetical protein